MSKGLQGIDQDTAYKIMCGKWGKLEVYRELFYYAWPQTFGSTAGPFSAPGLISGQAMTSFQMECWSDGKYNLIFCQGVVVQCLVIEGGRFSPDEYRKSQRG